MPRIFIADDDLEMRRLLGTSLRRAGFDIELADSGRVLLERLEVACAEEIAPDLIISDICMPDMNGLEALSRIRKDLPSVPVILITAFGDARTHALARSMGASAIFDKPFDLRLLQHTIESLLANPSSESSQSN